MLSDLQGKNTWLSIDTFFEKLPRKGLNIFTVETHRLEQRVLNWTTAVVGEAKDKLENMDVTYHFICMLPTWGQYFKLQQLTNGSLFLRDSLCIWKFGIFVTVSSWFQKISSNSLQMRAVWKKVFKNLFSARCDKFSFLEKCQKVLDFDNALWPNHSTHNKAKGIYGKMIFISFIWHPRVWNMPTGWVTMAQGKSWPHVGIGKKWVIRPYHLACPWSRVLTRGGSTSREDMPWLVKLSRE